MLVRAPGRHVLLPPGVEDRPGVSDQHHHLEAAEAGQQGGGLPQPQPHSLHQTERKERTGGGQIVAAEADRLSWLEVLAGGPEQGVASPQQKGILLPDDMSQESFSRLREVTLKLST